MSPSEISSLFTPLNKDFCLYFYYLSIFSFIILVLFVIGFVYTMIVSKGKDYTVVGYFLGLIFTYALMYFQYRLYYSMCVGSNMKGGNYLKVDSLPASGATAPAPTFGPA